LNELEDLREKINFCKICTLGLTSNKAVAGEGSAHSRIIIVGEAPGANEENDGRPFVGRGGKLLRNTLNEFKVNDVYITNIVKHRPPKNRRPTQKEIVACSPYLKFEIDFIKPEVILALGRTAIEYFGIHDKLSQVNGKVFTWNGIKIVACYHPAAVLRNPNLLPDFRHAVEQAKKILEI